MVEASSSGRQQQKIPDTMLWWVAGRGQGTAGPGSVTSTPEALCYLSSGSYCTSLPQAITPLLSPKPPVAPADPGPLLPQILLTVGSTASALPVFTTCVRAQWLQSGPTLCDPMDCSPPGSSVHGDSLGKNTGVGCHALLQGLQAVDISSDPVIPLLGKYPIEMCTRMCAQ